jgi:hypothetical protein
MSKRPIFDNSKPSSSVDASNGIFNNVGRDQHHTHITYIESGQHEFEIMVLRTERLLYRIAVFGVVGFVLLFGVVLWLVYTYMVSCFRVLER